jgi:dTMP kinase
VTGRLIVLEGGEASGKSTQAALLAQRLGALLTREPGGTATGERIRALLLDPSLPALDPRTETLLLLAARAQHVVEVIEPALAAGTDVVCDRYNGSTLAYQGWGRGLDPAELARMSAWAAAGVDPDLVVLLTVPPDVAATRLGRRGDPDRMEGQGDAFFARVEEGFSALAAAEPGRWRVVDGAGTVDDVAARVLAAVGTADMDGGDQAGRRPGAAWT